jgi:hypothetical protein
MPVTMIVEDGTGKADANTYRLVADADEYFRQTSDPDEWFDESIQRREFGLRMGSQYLDMVYGPSIQGGQVTSTQALSFPRSGVEIDGLQIPSTTIPKNWLDACCEAALQFLIRGELLEVAESPGTIESESFKVGSISESATYMGGKAQTAEFPKVELLVQDLIGIPRGSFNTWLD